MSVSITRMADELKEATAWQATPEVIYDQQYVDMIIRGIKKLYIDTNRPDEYNDDLIIEAENDILFNANLNIAEKHYVMLCSQIEFYKKVQTDVNNIVGYTTNALTVTNADKPYANLKNSIDALENERRIVYYKFVAYTLGE